MGTFGRADLYDISMFNTAFVRTVILGAALLLCLNAAPVHAQLRGKIAVGASAGTFQPSASELSTKSVVFIPTISRVPKQGWRVAVGLNWFNADVAGSFVNIPDQFGEFTSRPLMAGIQYTFMNGRFATTPSIVGGPAWNRLEVGDNLRGIYSVDGENEATTWSVAIRPGLSANYAFTERFGVMAFTGYLFNRPEFDVQTPLGEIRTRWKANGFALTGGIVVGLF